MAEKTGIAGRLSSVFLNSQITPLLAIAGLILGIIAVIITPREEEPQIDVTFANIFISYPGASPKEVEEIVSTPAEQILSELTGVKHIYSVSKHGMAILTVQFKVGQKRTPSIVQLYNAIYSKQDWLPNNLGVGQALIKPKGIDDVPIVTLTLWSKDTKKSSRELGKIAHALEIELKRIKGTRDIYTVGAPQQVVDIELDIEKLAAYNLSISDIRRAFNEANVTGPTGELLTQNHTFSVQAGTFLSTPAEIKNLVVALHKGKPVYLRNIAKINIDSEQTKTYTWHGQNNNPKNSTLYSAVTLVIAKQAGTNASNISNQIIERVKQLKGIVIPDEVEVTVTRDYGKTANQKASKLIQKLAFVTASVIFLVLLVLGWKEAIIVGVAVIITLALTLFASYVWGFTINRVSLFALIFSIGILVDDAIVVVENISRHLLLSTQNITKTIVKAVDEVGGPTILATLTVMAALLPMAFVTGLMGPYMSPIPINASIGMLISLLVAFILTPWMSRLLLRSEHSHSEFNKTDQALSNLSQKYLGFFLGDDKQARKRRRWLGGGVIFAILLSLSLVGLKLVIMKMLPFDNKSEFQIIIDMPENSSLESTARVTQALIKELNSIKEMTNLQAYVGGSGPINFNGLVRQYYLRAGNNVADIQVNLVDKHNRDLSSHDIVRKVRPKLQAIATKFNASVKVVEVPPGPPVYSPLVAEIYGPLYTEQIDLAKQIRNKFISTKDIVDVDDSIESAKSKYTIKINRQKAALSGVSQRTIYRALATIMRHEDVSYLHANNLKYPLPIRLQISQADKSDLNTILKLRIRSTSGKLVPISTLVSVTKGEEPKSIYHKDMRRVVYVTGDMAGAIDSPLYGMFNLASEIQKNLKFRNNTVEQFYFQQPEKPHQYSLKWDGEWQITFETFRDMGIAYSVGLLLIYMLVVAQFKSYLVPLVIMAPIPLTVIGVMPGHALLDTQFTATSMIGMIALAGIIVRNSILLVDFVNQQIESGIELTQAILQSAAVRAKPIAMTGLAAMVGAFFILDDPIFSGLAVSLIFGILVSTLLTLIVIPVLYYLLLKHKKNG